MSTQTGERIAPEFTIHDRLRKAREHAGLEQSELAARIGVSRGTIGNNEAGKVSVRPITIKAWALATGVAAEWLEHGNAPAQPRPDGSVESTDYTYTQVRHLAVAA